MLPRWVIDPRVWVQNCAADWLLQCCSYLRPVQTSILDDCLFANISRCRLVSRWRRFPTSTLSIVSKTKIRFGNKSISSKLVSLDNWLFFLLSLDISEKICSTVIEDSKNKRLYISTKYILYIYVGHYLYFEHLNWFLNIEEQRFKRNLTKLKCRQQEAIHTKFIQYWQRALDNNLWLLLFRVRGRVLPVGWLIFSSSVPPNFLLLIW